MDDPIKQGLDRMYDLALEHAAAVADLYAKGYPFLDETPADAARMIAREIRRKITGGTDGQGQRCKGTETEG